MQRRLGIALSLAALLIGGATWYRVAGASRPTSSLSVINSPEDSSITYIDAPIAEETSVSASTTDNLNTTDLIGRQLMSDFLALSSQGQATDENVNKLVENYASNLSNLGSYKPLESSDIKMTTDSKASLDSYSGNLKTNFDKYRTLARKVVESAGDLNDVESKNFSSTMNALGSLYSSSARELESITVPVSLASDHLKLINIYISSAKALSSIGSVGADAASAYAALNTQANNSAEETEILLSIQAKLLRSGVLFNPSI